MDPTDITMLLLRLIIGGTMIAHGANHWLGGGKISGTARWFEGLGLRNGVLQAWLSVFTEIGAGVFLLLGVFTAFAGAAIISVMSVAGLLAHRRNGFFVFKDGYEYVLVMAVAALAVAAVGPGRVSIDHAAGIEVTGWNGMAVAAGLAVISTAALLLMFWRPEPERTSK